MLSNSLEKARAVHIKVSIRYNILPFQHSESLMNIADTVGRSLDVHANNIVNAAQKKTRELFMAVVIILSCDWLLSTLSERYQDRVGDQLFMIGTDVVNFHNVSCFSFWELHGSNITASPSAILLVLSNWLLLNLKPTQNKR